MNIFFIMMLSIEIGQRTEMSFGSKVPRYDTFVHLSMFFPINVFMKLNSSND